MKAQTSNAICSWYKTITEELSTQGAMLSRLDLEEGGACKKRGAETEQ